jgi:arsenate reductase
VFLHHVHKYLLSGRGFQTIDFGNNTVCRRDDKNITLCRNFARMKKIYYLSTCSTCERILKEMEAGKKGFSLQDIKTEKITAAQLDALKEKVGSYEALFSRRAIKYKEMGLKVKPLTEKDYRRLILEEYTFLKRPVVVSGDKVFVGSDKGTVEALKAI